MRVVADVHEPARVVTALAGLGMDVVVRRLAIGDYDVGAGTLVGRKTISTIARRRAQQPIRRRWPHTGRPPAVPHTAPMLILAAIDGVSDARATALLDRFGSVANMAAASKAELMKTHGVHATIAKRIHESLH
jgi:ERCC4-type nuclease